MNRQDIIKCAYSWVDTPYHHQAGVKGVGVDCAYLIGKVAEEVGAIEKFKVDPYSIEWHWHSKEERMCAIVEEFGAIRVDEPKPGDILAFKYGRVCSHLGIMVRDNRFIHAHITSGKVLINTLSGDFLARLDRVYQFPNLEENI